MSRVLVIATHPDDETLGCCGSILRHKSKGDEIHWLILTNIFEKDGWREDIVKKREIEINRVADETGFNSVTKLDFPTTKLDMYPMSDLVSGISRAIMAIKPNIIYVNNRSDIHTDHQIAFKAVISCIKNFRYPFLSRLLMYETLSETEFAASLIENVFQPNVFIDITEFFEKKISIMKVYNSEIMDPPYPRSLETIEALAKYRGSRIGKRYAEAFMLIEEQLN